MSKNVVKKAVGYEDHGKPSFHLYMSEELQEKWENGFQEVNQDPSVEFLKGVRIIKTERGNHVVKEEEGWCVMNIFYHCGYRGESRIYLSGLNENDLALWYLSYSSPRGKEGISEGVLVSVKIPTTLKVHAERSGRTYGKPNEARIVVDVNEEVKVSEDLPEDVLNHL